MILFFLPLLLQADIILDREPLMKPVEDAWIDTETGRFQSPIILKEYRDGTYLTLWQTEDFPALLEGFRKDQFTVMLEPLSIPKGDRFTESGGALIRLGYIGGRSSTKIQCGSPPGPKSKCWSEWVAGRKDKPEFPPVQTWDIGIPKSERDYPARVQASLENRIETLTLTLKHLKGVRLEALWLKHQASEDYEALQCEEGSYHSDKHFQDCRLALTELVQLITEYRRIEADMVRIGQEIDEYKASIAGIKVLRGEYEHPLPKKDSVKVVP